MAKLRAVVLAAGRGVRMGGQQPKTLIPMDGQQPLLHYILAGIRAAGIDDLMVVTGFKPGEVQEYVNSEWGADGVTYVFNARYASWGNFHTVRLALDQSPGFDVLVVNSDVVVHPEVYKRVAGTPGDLVLAVQPRRQLDDEDMRVYLRGNQVLGIGKDVSRARSHAEFAGVSMIRPIAASAYLDVASDLEWTHETSIYYEDVYARILDRVVARAATVGPDEYAEVDNPEDVPAAVRVIEALA